MPTGVDTVIRSLQQSLAQRGRADAAAQAMQMKQQQMQLLEAYRKSLTDYRQGLGQKADQRIKIAQEAEDQKKGQAKAWTEYLMNSDLNKFPDSAKASVVNARAYIAAARVKGVPDEYLGDFSKSVANAAKPHAYSIVGTPVKNPDGSTSTVFTVKEPDTESMGAVSGTSEIDNTVDPSAGADDEAAGADGGADDFPEFP